MSRGIRRIVNGCAAHQVVAAGRRPKDGGATAKPLDIVHETGMQRMMETYGRLYGTLAKRLP